MVKKSLYKNNLSSPLFHVLLLNKFLIFGTNAFMINTYSVSVYQVVYPNVLKIERRYILIFSFYSQAQIKRALSISDDSEIVVKTSYNRFLLLCV